MPLPVRTVTVSEEAMSSASSSISCCVAGLARGTTDAILLGSPKTTAILGAAGGAPRGGTGDLCCRWGSPRGVEVDVDDIERRSNSSSPSSVILSRGRAATAATATRALLAVDGDATSWAGRGARVEGMARSRRESNIRREC